MVRGPMQSNLRGCWLKCILLMASLGVGPQYSAFLTYNPRQAQSSCKLGLMLKVGEREA